MKITFVRPNMTDTRSSDALEPYVFAILSALTPPDVERVLYDERLQSVPLDEPTDLVAMTVETFTARRAYQLAEAYHKRGVPVVMGGYHPTLLPTEVAEHATSVAVGDAETTWPDIVSDARRGSLKPSYVARSPSVDRMVVDRSIYAGKRYGRLAIVQYGRGCRYACDFCSIRAFYNGHRDYRKVDDVVAEVVAVGRRPIFFADDNIASDRDRALALFGALTPLGRKWACQVSLDVTDDESLVRAMAQSGCFCAIVGFESLEEKNLTQMNKAWNRGRDRYQRAIRVLKKNGIMIYGTFALGYDNDTSQTIEECLDFCLDNRFFRANFNPLTPTPGTPLYQRLEKEGRLIHNPWWLHPEYRYGQAAFHPTGMTAVDLETACYRARTRFNTIGNILNRSLGVPLGFHWVSQVAIHWAANLISRREIHRRQGMTLGASGRR